MGDSLAVVTLGGAAAAAVWVGGYRPAIIVAILGYLACNYLFIEPRGRLAFGGPGDLIGLLAYLFTSSLVIGFGEAMRLAQMRASERRELMQVTLGSIGDAVITTDVSGCVTYMNAVAESLTGWKARDAVGEPLDAVFRIVNEDTRQPVENPAAKALRAGVVVGLVNHTVLIRKDGASARFDDSAAPIRDERGHVSGCVLIFRDVSAQRRLEQDKARQHRRRRPDRCEPESGTTDRTFRDRAPGIRRPPHSRVTHPLADQRRGGRCRRRVKIVRDVTLQRQAQQRERHLLAEASAANAKAHALFEQGALFCRDHGRERHDRRSEPSVLEGVRLYQGANHRQAVLGRSVVGPLGGSGRTDQGGVGSSSGGADLSRRNALFPEDQPRIVQEFLPSILEKGHGELEIRFRHFKNGEARWMAYKVLTLPDAAGRPIAFATVSQDVTERKRLEDNLRRLAVDLSEVDRRKNEFLGMLAHALRNPLAPISNATRMLRLGGRDDGETLRSASDTLERQVRQLARLVDDLLDMSRITRGKIELRKEQIELMPIVHQAVETVRPLYSKMNHELTVTLPPQTTHLDADPARLAQVAQRAGETDGQVFSRDRRQLR